MARDVHGISDGAYAMAESNWQERTNQKPPKPSKFRTGIASAAVATVGALYAAFGTSAAHNDIDTEKIIEVVNSCEEKTQNVKDFAHCMRGQISDINSAEALQVMNRGGGLAIIGMLGFAGSFARTVRQNKKCEAFRNEIREEAQRLQTLMDEGPKLT